jgi:CRISPR-associated protein Csx14
MKTILLAVVGLSPQVITETLYALHQQGCIVDAVHVITTRKGREAIETRLLSPRSGQYFRYLEDYGIPPDAIDFGHHYVHTIVDKEGLEIDDIETEEDNERLLQLCLDLTFRFTQDPRATVLFSIAGGRKTMSACLMTAVQLYARPQDRCYHVLVSPEFENNEHFFYPPPRPTSVELIDRLGRRHIRSSGQCRVTLLHIPFITIRDQLAPAILQAPADPESLMLALIRDVQYDLTVDLAAGKVIYKNQELLLMPARLALFAFFALQKKNCPNTDPQRSCRYCSDCYLDYASVSAHQNEITSLYRRIGSSRALSDLSNSGIAGLTAENFNSYKGKLRRDLAEAFGLYAAGQLAIEGKGKKPDRRYGIRMDKGRIRVVF